MKREITFPISDSEKESKKSMNNIKDVVRAFNSEKRVEAGVALGEFIVDAMLAIANAPFEKLKHFLPEHLQDDPKMHERAVHNALDANRKKMDISASRQRRVLLLANWKDEILAQNSKTLTAAYSMADGLHRVQNATKRQTVNMKLVSMKI